MRACPSGCPTPSRARGSALPPRASRLGHPKNTWWCWCCWCCLWCLYWCWCWCWCWRWCWRCWRCAIPTPSGAATETILTPLQSARRSHHFSIFGTPISPDQAEQSLSPTGCFRHWKPELPGAIPTPSGAATEIILAPLTISLTSRLFRCFPFTCVCGEVAANTYTNNDDGCLPPQHFTVMASRRRLSRQTPSSLPPAEPPGNGRFNRRPPPTSTAFVRARTHTHPDNQAKDRTRNGGASQNQPG